MGNIINWVSSLFKTKENVSKDAMNWIETKKSCYTGLQKSEDIKYELIVLDKRARRVVRRKTYDWNSGGIYIPDIKMSGHIYTIWDENVAKYSGDGSKEREQQYIDKRVEELMKEEKANLI